MKRVENLGLHFFLAVDLIRINTARRKHFFGKSTGYICTGKDSFRSGIGIRNKADSGVGTEKIYMEGISHTLADFSVKSLDL